MVLPYIDMNQPWVYICSPSWPSLPIPSLRVIPAHQLWAPCLMHQPGLAIYFTYDNIHVSMLFSHITPPSPSPTESKKLFYTSVSLLLSCIQGHRYHLSKFHIYVLVYCIGVFLSGLLHSVNWSLLYRDYIFLVLKKISLSGYTTVYLSTYLLKDILVASRVLRLWIKLL